MNLRRKLSEQEDKNERKGLFFSSKTQMETKMCGFGGVGRGVAHTVGYQYKMNVERNFSYFYTHFLLFVVLTTHFYISSEFY